MATRFTLPHIDITRFATPADYMGSSAGGGGDARVRREHGRRMQHQLEAAFRMADEIRVADNRLPAPQGVRIEVELRRGERADTLTQTSAGIQTGAAKTGENNNKIVSLYVPDEARPILDTILENYLSGPVSERTGNPPNQAKVEAIEAFRIARLETVWTDDPDALPRDPQHVMWWGLWCHKGQEEEIEAACAALDVRAAGDDWRLKFPEITVIPVLASRATIELMLFATKAIAELRRASENPAFFLNESQGDAHEWIEDLAERIIWPAGDAPSVCVIDSGVNRGHALIEPALAANDLHAIDRDWGGHDHIRGGHGTMMGGMALHGDLTAALADRDERQLKHRLESVKILPPRGFTANDPRNYGIITQTAVVLPEIAAPERARVFCMAITHENVTGATPSSWSAAIDQAAAGTMPADGEDAPKRLVVLSAGNVPPHYQMHRARPQSDYPVESPAQAWNALTVGCYTDRIDIQDDGFDDWTPMVEAGNLSPHSRTSEAWPQNTPFKPEIVMEGGNRAVSPDRATATTLESLSLLATGPDAASPLVSFAATSAASAQAARLAARISADHPEFWPETVRALVIHSAEWTAPMFAQFGGGKRQRYSMVRRFGYGVPDYERATASARDSLALFAQTTIQPFRFAGGRKFGQCHYYDLPIPRRMLEDLYNEEVELKVTLSYFIDPNPGLAANVEPQRYQSHGLRFDLRRKGETVDVFKRRVNASEREDWRVGPDAPDDDERWMLGPQSVSSGSLHCDVWRGPAIELLDRDMLCVKPVNGWCRQRSTADICDQERRYALIVTLKTKNQTLDIYTPISAAVEVPVGVEVETGRDGRSGGGDLFSDMVP